MPLTVTARRNARLRAAALATIPLILFVVAVVPRVWAPDLVPFGRLQASYVAQAEQRAPVSWSDAYADPTVTALALVEPVIGYKPASTVPWIVLRGLLDALGVALLYLAARRLAGPVGGALTALVYAASPFAWELSREPTGSIGPVLTAAAMLAAVWLVQGPTLVRGAVFGLLLGLLARTLPFGPLVIVIGAVVLLVGRAGWPVSGIAALTLIVVSGNAFTSWIPRFGGGSVTPIDPAAIQPAFILLLAIPMGMAIREVRWVARVFAAVLVTAGSYGIVWTMHADRQTEWQHPAFINRPPGMHGEGQRRPEAGGSLARSPNYREAVALTTAMEEAAGRADTNEVVLLRGYIPEWMTPFPYDLMLDGGQTAVLANNVVLPLERETVFLIASQGQMPLYPERPIEIRRPSSSIRILTSQGADTGLELFTLRPRSAADWLSRVHTVSNGTFADGSRLLGVDAAYREGRILDVSLYWEMLPADGRRPQSDRVKVGFVDTPADGFREVHFPPVGARRKEYLLLMQARLTDVSDAARAGPLRLTLLDDRLQPIRTAGGEVSLDVPLPGLRR